MSVNVDGSVDHYANLGVAQNAHIDEIRKCYFRLAREFHPDRNRGRESQVTARFQEVQAAWETLNTKRADYDNARRAYLQKQRREQFRAANPPPWTRPAPPRPAPRPPPPPPTPRRPPPNHGFHTNPDPSAYGRKPANAPPPSPPRAVPRWAPTPSRAGPKVPQPPPSPYASHNPPGPPPFPRPPAGPPPNAHTKDQDKAAREKVFEAWANMKGGPPVAGKGANNQARPSVPNPLNNPNGVPFGRSQSTRMPKKGFNPATPGADEGQAPSANYGRPHSGSQRYADPLRRFSQQVDEPDVPFSEANRVRTPYSGAGVSRPSSVRSSPTYGPSSTEDGDSSTDSSTATRNVPKATPVNQPNVTPSNPFKSRSAEGINMRFSPSDWHGKFEGGADYFVPNPSTASRDRTSPVRGRPPMRTPTGSFTSQRGQSAAHMPPPPPRPVSTPMSSDASFGSSKEPAPHMAEFSEDRWKETFKEPNFTFSPQPTPSAVQTPRRPSAPNARVKAVPLSRKPSAMPGSDPKATGATVNSEGGEARRRHQAFAEDAQGAETDEMDIDFEEPVQQTSKRPAEEAADDTGVNLDGFEVVEPFKPSANGLSGLNDIGDTLPFPSQASTIHPTKASVPHQLKLPELPVIPSVPAVIEPLGTKQFFDQIHIFFAKYRHLNKVATEHFRAREEELLDLDEGWLINRGESTSKIGFATYAIKTEEDNNVHKQWNAARALHDIAMSRAREMREKTQKENQYVS